MLLIILELVFLLVLLILLKIVHKSLKKIWQKISIVYNQIYEKMIAYYYATDIRRDLLRWEIIDYYNTVILKSSPYLQKKGFEYSRWFIKELLGKYIGPELDILEELYEYYDSISRLINILVLMSMFLFVSIFIFWFLNY